MATHDYVIDNSTGANVRADINNVLQAILTNNSSSSAPSTTAAYMWWADTTNGILKIRNSSNNDWVELLQLDGTLTLEDGSATTPALAFRDDLNTGIFSSAADHIEISAGGTERVSFGTSGVAFNDGGEDYDFRIEGDTNQDLFFVDAGNDKIGFGTSTITDGVFCFNSGTGNSVANFVSSDAGAVVNITDSHTRSSIEQNNTDLKIISDTGNADADSTIKLQVDGGTKMQIDSSGNVGIGTTTNYEDSVLEVRKAAGGDGVAIRVTNDTTTNGSQAGIIFTNTTSDFTSAAIAHKRNDNALIFYNGQSNSAGGFANGIERMRLGSSGEVYIGTSSWPTGSLGKAAGRVMIGEEGSLTLWNETNSSGGGATLKLSCKEGSDATRVGFVNLVGGTENTTDRASFFKIQVANSSGSGIERLSIASGGDVTVSDGNLVLASGHGIDFSATGTGTGTSSTAEIFKDYEEGSFTLALGGTWTSNPTSLAGGYVKIGRMVHIFANFASGSKSSLISGYFQGLPFATTNFGTGAVVDSNVANQGNALFFNTDRIWVTDNSFNSTTYVTGQYTTDD